MKILSADEVTSTIFLMTEKFQEAIKQFLISEAKFASLFNEFTLLKQQVEEISTTQSSLKDSSAQSISSLDSKNMGLYTDLSSSVSSVSKIVDSCSKSSEVIKQELQTLRDGVSKLAENHNSLSKSGSLSIAEVKADIEDVQSTIVNLAQKWEDKDVSNKGVISDVKNLVNMLSSDLVETKGTLREFVGTTSGFQKDLASHKEATASQFEQMNQALMFHIEDKLAALTKQSIAPTISPDDAKALVQKQVEPASLDAKNANLRSSNNEQKITLLEKKVETLQLLLNKLQIA